jgi:hypothetical protein
VFLSYSEESYANREIVKRIKDCVQSRGLSVFDEQLDLLPDQDEAAFVLPAGLCAAFVLIMTRAYVEDPLTRLRLHKVQQALTSGQVYKPVYIIVRFFKQSECERLIDVTEHYLKFLVHVFIWIYNYAI